MATNLRKIRAQIERAIEDKVINGLFKRRERLESNLLAKLKQNFAEEFAVDPTTKELRGSGNLVGELGLQNPAAKVAALEGFIVNSFQVRSVAKSTARRNRSIRFRIEMASSSDILAQSFALQPNTNRKGILTQLEGGGTGWYVSTAGTLAPAWSSGVSVVLHELRSNAGHVYYASAAGTTGATAPTHTSGASSDGSVTWEYYGGVAVLTAR